MSCQFPHKCLGKIMLKYTLLICLSFLLLFSFSCRDNENEIKQLKNRITELEKELSDYKSNPQFTLAQLKDAFAKGSYDSVKIYVETICKFHPGSSEAKEAQLYIKSIDSINAHQKMQIELAVEKERIEKNKSAAQKIHDIIRVKYVRTDEPNSAGGVDLHIYWQNTSKKTIKYVRFTVDAYNRVNDLARCSIRRESEFTGKVTGPIKPGQWYGGDIIWPCAWYNSTIVKAILTKIKIEYMDGTTCEIDGPDLMYAVY